MSIYGFRREVVCYVTRSTPSRQLLVFEHSDDDPANPSGLHVPAGGMQPFESLADAATRGVYEETGLSGLKYVDQVGYVERGLDDTGGPAVVNFVHLAASTDSEPPTSEARSQAAPATVWEHLVTGDGEHADLVFRCRWEPLPLRTRLAGDQGAFLQSVPT